MRLFDTLLHGEPSPPPLDEVIHWGRDLSVGSPLLDGEHREIAAILNTLFQHHRHGGRAPDCGHLLARLRDLLQVHTENEEAILSRHRCPALVEHQQAHRQILAELAELSHRLPHLPQAAAEAALAAAVRHIILDHILVHDMAARDYLHE